MRAEIYKNYPGFRIEIEHEDGTHLYTIYVDRIDIGNGVLEAIGCAH